MGSKWRCFTSKWLVSPMCTWCAPQSSQAILIGQEKRKAALEEQISSNSSQTAGWLACFFLKEGNPCKHALDGGNSNILYVHPYLGKIPILTNIFQVGWNHQLDVVTSIFSGIICLDKGGCFLFFGGNWGKMNSICFLFKFGWLNHQVILWCLYIYIYISPNLRTTRSILEVYKQH